MPNLLDLALAYTKAGVSVIPILPQEGIGSNGPRDLPFDCREHISRRIATPEELREWFPVDGQFGLAAVLGRISGGLECLDLTYAAVVKLFRRLVALQGGTGLLEKLPAAQSNPDGRTRLYYRFSNTTRGYRRIAQLEVASEPGTVKLQLLAYVHGEGNWTLLPGSPAAGVGSNEVYEWLGPDLSQVPSLTEDERQLLLESASCLNAWIDPSAILAPENPVGFDTNMTWEEILLPLGWVKIEEFGEIVVWRSPGRTKPGYCAISGIGFNRDLLYLTRTGRGYTKFGAFASFCFGRDLEKARTVRLRIAAPSRWETAAGRSYLRALRKTSLPLVSCIMPTTSDRRRLLPQTIRCFQQQTYPNLELVIVCDGEEDLSDLIPGNDGRIHYFYLGRERRTIGAKSNLACEKASGDLIAHFDDDDWSHPDRLNFQVGALLAEEAEFCGISRLLFLELGTGAVWLCQTPAVLHPSLFHFLSFGATYLYQRSYWSRSPFQDITINSDLAFVVAEGRQDSCVLVSDYGLYVAIIHDSNTVQYSGKSSYWSLWEGNLREVMGADLDFYRSLRQR